MTKTPATLASILLDARPYVGSELAYNVADEIANGNAARAQAMLDFCATSIRFYTTQACAARVDGNMEKLNFSQDRIAKESQLAAAVRCYMAAG